MARRKHHEEHANHEAWAIPYADLMTLLLAFFVVMYAISSLNEGKYRVMADALNAAFGGAPRTINPVQIGNNQLQGADFDRPSPIRSGAKAGPSAPSPAPNVTLLAAMASQMNMSAGDDGMQSAHRQLESIAGDIEQALKPLLDKDLVVMRRSQLWLEVQINSDILFAPGSATLEPSARDTVRELSNVLADVPNHVRVEGHTDNRPIATYQYPSNWELSAARAASVLHMFAQQGLAPERLAMIGYGEFRPVADNATVEGRNQNRRVLLIILASDESPSLPVDPALIAGQSPPTSPAPAATAPPAQAAAATLPSIAPTLVAPLQTAPPPAATTVSAGTTTLSKGAN
ncbi:flagellar motor protein MotD [Pseudoxanthomonas dokdonensis]|uniref:Flagellar motor protein MotD n=1 Tax=Pseudoxanthomonas dokdonensis TaxID=344882 RepID=A0A0R0CM86_9GAMM|nr:flagellar motor protein MotD [Pseudoxanthomonas dokdonensis]KRG71039.1 flagellar motor protein MotD [Pseudoxanthomonas dokdonensis]